MTAMQLLILHSECLNWIMHVTQVVPLVSNKRQRGRKSVGSCLNEMFAKISKFLFSMTKLLSKIGT